MRTKANTMQKRPWLGGILLGLVGMMGGGVSCSGDSRHDAYIEGLRLAGIADRQECKLIYDEAGHTHVLNSAKIGDCLAANKEVLVKFEEAEKKGLEGREITVTLEKTRDRIKRLESMLRMIKKMEIEKKIDMVH